MFLIMNFKLSGIYQKYFEPLFLIILSVMYKNFLVMNVLKIKIYYYILLIELYYI